MGLIGIRMHDLGSTMQKQKQIRLRSIAAGEKKTRKISVIQILNISMAKISEFGNWKRFFPIGAMLLLRYRVTYRYRLVIFRIVFEKTPFRG